jgi:hypothetical protein
MKPHIQTMLFAALTLSLAACRKDKDEPDDLDYTSASDNARAEDYFNDMLSEADNAAKDHDLRSMDDGCEPVVTIDTVAMPHTMLIDFGTVNCTANNGRLRRGKILVTFTGPYRAIGTVITITPQDYYVNNNHVEGVKTVTNMGPDADGHTYFNVQVDGTITAGDGSWTSQHHATRVRTWVEGESTITPFDDVYLITGSGNGVNRNGVAYTLTITQALRIAIGCPWITAGKLELTPDGHATRYVDFGSGSCDPNVTVTVNGVTFNFIMG